MSKLNHVYYPEKILFADKYIRNGGDNVMKVGPSRYTVVSD